MRPRKTKTKRAGRCSRARRYSRELYSGKTCPTTSIGNVSQRCSPSVCAPTTTTVAQDSNAFPCARSRAALACDLLHALQRPPWRSVSNVASLLFVDDNAPLRRTISRLLSEDGHTIETAENGDHALQLLDAGAEVDLVITDLVMPDKEGLELIGCLRKRYPQLKIIAVSGGGVIEPERYLNIAKSLGADAVLRKPLGHTELTELITKVLNGYSAQ
ncbi:MAG: hypothetical protein CSA65_07330 [Proteobacteria bacterium]|nr:MAG: hypothetical protein CSB49_02260 [Pseudomonadota bacterium]PIE17827.1 MAG: hypothetical protein CSA65_07330 [Pseudomonadota bacterium]